MAKNSIGWLLFRCFSVFIDLRSLYEDIKKNPEAKKISTVMGKKALVYWAVSLVCILLTGGLVIWGSSMLKTALIVFGIIIIIAAVILAIYAVGYFLISLNATIKQLCLNHRAIGWIVLSLLILTLAATTAVVILIVT